MQLNNETRLLLCLSRVKPGSSVLKQAQTIIDEGIDWSLLVAISGKHGTFNLVCRNLKELKGVPPDVLSKLEKSYYATLHKNILNLSELDRIIDRLNSAGVEVISLKGPATTEKIFGDPGLYPSDDIDILIRVGDIDAMKGFLESDGYTLLDKGFDDYRDFFIKELYHISLSKGRYTIEPHWNLFFRYFTTPPEFWWEDSRPVTRGGRSYWFLSPEKNILYNSFRLFLKSFFPLRFMVMVAELIRFYQDEIDWELMSCYARRYGFENVLGTVLLMSVDLLGAKVPGKYANVKNLRSRILYKMSLKIMLSGTVPHPVHKIALAFMKDDFVGAIGVVLRRLFPSMGEIVSRYQLSVHSGKAVVYYLLNPFFFL